MPASASYDDHFHFRPVPVFRHGNFAKTHDKFRPVQSEQNEEVCNNLYLCGFMTRLLMFPGHFVRLFFAFIPEKKIK
jgi:hypothetical protein